MLLSYKNFIKNSVLLLVSCIMESHVPAFINAAQVVIPPVNLVTRATLIEKIQNLRQQISVNQTTISNPYDIVIEVVDLQKKLQEAIQDLENFDTLYHQINNSVGEQSLALQMVPFCVNDILPQTISQYNGDSKLETITEQNFVHNQQFMKDFYESLGLSQPVTDEEPKNTITGSAYKKAMAMIGSIVVAALGKYAYDNVRNVDTVINTGVVEPINASVVSPQSSLNNDRAVSEIITFDTLFKSEKSTLNNVPATPVVTSMFQSIKLQTYDKLSRLSLLHNIEMPEITNKNIAIAVATTIGMFAVCYKLLAAKTAPSIEDLAKTYIYETKEQDFMVIMTQFNQALEKHGYTSQADQQKAIKMLEDFVLIQA